MSCHAPFLVWLVCDRCGWEHTYPVGCGSVCPSCGVGNIHFHSDRDGEQPQRLPRHSTGCSNVNTIHPVGRYTDVETCGCNPEAVQRYHNLNDSPHRRRSP